MTPHFYKGGGGIIPSLQERRKAHHFLQGRERDHSFSESEEEGATPLTPSLKESRHSVSESEGGMPITLSMKESRHSFSEIEGGMPSTLPMKESCHSFSEREGEGQPSLLPEKGGGDEVPLTSIREEEEKSIILSVKESHHPINSVFKFQFSIFRFGTSENRKLKNDN